MALDRHHQRVLAHFARHVRRGVVCAFGHPVRRAVGFGHGYQILEQVAQHFRVDGLVAVGRRMLQRRPVVFGEDGEQAGALWVRSEVIFVVEAQRVVARVPREQRAVQEARVAERGVYRRNRVSAPTAYRLVEALVEHVRQDVIVVRAGRVGAGERLVERFLRELAVFLENPREQRAYQMAQYGFSVSPPRLRAAPRFAILAQRPAARHRLVELFAQPLRVHRVHEAGRGRGRRPSEVVVDALDGAQNHGRRRARVELRRHSRMPLMVDGYPNLRRVAVFVRLNRQRDRHVHGRDSGERGRDKRDVLSVQRCVVFRLGFRHSDDRHAERLAAEVALLGLDSPRGRVCVLVPMRALGVSRLAPKLQLAGEGRSASPDVRQALENLLRARAVGNGVGESANVRRRDRSAERGRARRVLEHALHLIERAGGVRRRQVEQAGFGEQLDAAAVRVSADDAPHVAVGERAERVRSGASVAGDVSGYLLLGAVLLRLAVAVQVRPKRLRLDNGGGGNAPRYLRRIPPDDDIRAVPVYLPFAPRLRLRKSEMAQNRVDKVAYRIRLAERGRPQYRGVLPNQLDCFQRVWHWEYSYPVGGESCCRIFVLPRIRVSSVGDRMWSLESLSSFATGSSSGGR